MKVAESQFDVDAAAQRAIESNIGLAELQNDIESIDQRIAALQEERRDKRKQQEVLMRKAITAALENPKS